MATEVIMPKQGLQMTEGKIVDGHMEPAQSELSIMDAAEFKIIELQLEVVEINASAGVGSRLGQIQGIGSARDDHEFR